MTLVGKDTNPKDAIGATKAPLSLCSPIAKAQWALAQLAGKLKYGAWNWRAAGVRSSIYLDAIQRHADAYLSGEETDPVDGTHHLGNIMACCAILLDAKAAGKLVDDRPPSVSVRPVYEAAEKMIAMLKGQYADKSPRHWTVDDTGAIAGEEKPAVAVATWKVGAAVRPLKGPHTGAVGRVIQDWCAQADSKYRYSVFFPLGSYTCWYAADELAAA